MQNLVCAAQREFSRKTAASPYFTSTYGGFRSAHKRMQNLDSYETYDTPAVVLSASRKLCDGKDLQHLYMRDFQLVHAVLSVWIERADRRVRLVLPCRHVHLPLRDCRQA